VYTSEYGWIWMPYGGQYTYEGTASDASPYSYVYYPSYGWMWLAAPWIWGWGAYPYFGPRGPGGFGWYAGLYRAGYGWVDTTAALAADTAVAFVPGMVSVVAIAGAGASRAVGGFRGGVWQLASFRWIPRRWWRLAWWRPRRRASLKAHLHRKKDTPNDSVRWRSLAWLSM